MDLFEYSDYGIVPSGNGLNVIRKYTKTNNHAEKVTFYDNYIVWLVEILPYRQTQRDWARNKFRNQGVKDAINLCSAANYFLVKPLAQRKNPDGTASFQWLQRWLRCELVMLKNAAMDWLSINSSCNVSYGSLDTERLWMCPGIGPLEAEYSPKNPEGNLVIRNLDVEGTRISAPVLDLPEEFENLPKLDIVRNIVKEPASKESSEVLQKLWYYLPVDMEDTILVKAAPTWPTFPNPDYIGRNKKGGNVMAKWLLLQKYKKDREPYSSHEVKKQEEKQIKAEKAYLKSQEPDPLWGF